MTEIKSENRTDEELFEKFRDANDNDAFMIIYHRYSQKILSYCLRATGDRDAAKDIFQKVFLNVVEKKKSFKGGSLVAWIMIITRNFCLLEKRNTKITTELEDHTLVDKSYQDDFTLNEIIRTEIEKLPEEFRDVIKLKYFDDFSYNDIAEMTGVSLSLVKVRLFRAKKLLSEALKEIRETS